MRLDKFLKVSRLVKRRTVANSISELGRVFVNGTIAKPAKQLKVGDIIMIEYANKTVQAKVLEIPQGNVPTQLASTLYEIIKHNRSLTAAAQCEQVEKLNNQINELKRQARDIRIKNERDFEALLTAKQKKELAKIKENARKEMMKNHKKQPPKCPPRGPQK